MSSFCISLRSGKGYSFQRDNGGAIVWVFAGGVTFHLIVFFEYMMHKWLTSLFPCSKALFCLSCNLEEYSVLGEPSDAQLPSSIAVTIRDAFAEQGDPAWRTGVLSEVVALLPGLLREASVFTDAQRANLAHFLRKVPWKRQTKAKQQLIGPWRMSGYAGRPATGSGPFLLHQPGEVFERSVIGALCVSREAASRQFAAFQMILQAFAADAFSRAGLITAIAVLEMVLFLTLHRAPRSCRPWQSPH